MVAANRWGAIADGDLHHPHQRVPNSGLGDVMTCVPSLGTCLSFLIAGFTCAQRTARCVPAKPLESSSLKSKVHWSPDHQSIHTLYQKMGNLVRSPSGVTYFPSVTDRVQTSFLQNSHGKLVSQKPPENIARTSVKLGEALSGTSCAWEDRGRGCVEEVAVGLFM